MRTKATFLLGAATGYVLGARAGRERYEQIKRLAGNVWGNPTVQEKVVHLEDKATETAKSGGSRLQGKAVTAAKSAVSTAQSKVADLRSHDTPSEARGPVASTYPITDPYTPAGSNGQPL